MPNSPPKPLTLVRIALMVASAAGVILNVLVPTTYDGFLHVAAIVVYSLALALVGLTFATPWTRRYACEIVLVIVYVLTGADTIANILGGYPLAPMWVAVICLGGAIAAGSVAWKTRVLGIYLAYQLAVVLAAGIGHWPQETLISVLGGLVAVDALALVLTHNRITSEWALRRAISALREHEAELEEALTRSTEAGRLKSAILAAMSHEIRTPLTSVIGSSTFLAEELDLDASPSDAGARDRVDLARSIQRGGERLLRTFDSVLNLARLEAEAVDLQLEAVDVTEIVQRTVAHHAATADALSVQIDAPADPVVLHADAEALRRAVEHLVHNAFTYTSVGGVTVELTEAPDAIEIAVTDTGPGIEAALLPTLFEPFRQAIEGHNRTHEGLGLGLTLAHQLAEAMGGAIYAESVVGQGSRFTLRLPRTASSPARRSDADVLEMVA